MPYTSQEKLIAKFGTRFLVNLTDRGDEPTQAIDSEIIASAIADADAVIDGYIGERFSLPLVSTPPLIESLAEKIAIKELHVYGAPDEVKEDYDRALKMLREIADGTVSLPLPETSQEPPKASVNGVRATDRKRPLTAANLKGFIG